VANGVGVMSVKTVLESSFGLQALSFVIPTFWKFIVFPSLGKKGCAEGTIFVGS